MFAYIVRRLALIPLTLFGIVAFNFILVQFLPGGPVEKMIATLEGHDVAATARFSGQGGSEVAGGSGGGNGAKGSAYKGAKGLDPELIKEIEHLYGFDKPAHERFARMLVNYATFDLGDSYYRDKSVVGLFIEKLPVSVSLGVWSTLIIYVISIPLGIRKAVADGSRFDAATSWVVLIGYAIPAFLFAILLVVLFAGGQYLDWFPLRGLVSDNFDELSWPMKIADYFWHLALPVTAMVIGGFARLTMLTKNSFLEEIKKQYVVTAYAKGLTEKRVLYGHVFRNAMLLVIAGFPAQLIDMLFTGSILIETIFSLDGIGLLSFQSVVNRDYPVVFGTVFAFGILGLLLKLVSDLTYHAVDPRIDFEARL